MTFIYSLLDLYHNIKVTLFNKYISSNTIYTYNYITFKKIKFVWKIGINRNNDEK